MRSTISLQRLELAAVALPVVATLFCGELLGQVSVDRLYPPAARIGAKTNLKAEGKFPSWPVQAVADRDGVKIESGAEKGQFEVLVDEHAHPGVAWIRMMDSANASTLTPLLIGPATVLAETEPNDRLNQANAGPLPLAMVGKLERNGDVDAWKVPLKGGQTLVANVTANRVLRSPMDAVLQLTDDRGNVLFQSDDGRGLDPRIVFTAKSDGDYFLRIFAFPETPNSTIGFAGASTFVYQIEATVGPYLDAVLPMAFRESDGPDRHRMLGWNLTSSETLKSHVDRAQGVATLFAVGSLGWQTLPLLDGQSVIQVEQDPSSAATESSAAPTLPHPPAYFGGVISQPKEIDKFEFAAKKDKKYRVLVRSRALGFQLDSAVTVSTADGKQLASNDDVSSNDYDSAVTATATADGPIHLAIRDVTDGYSQSHVYAISVKELEADFTLAMDADHFVVESGSTFEVPVTIDRIEGMSGDIQIQAIDLPAGVTSAPVDSQGKGNSAKKVSLKIDASGAMPLQGSFRVVGKPKDAASGADSTVSRTATLPLRDSYSLSKFWLTVKAK